MIDIPRERLAGDADRLSNDSSGHRVTADAWLLPKITVSGYSDEASLALCVVARQAAAALVGRHAFMLFGRLECLLIPHDFGAALRFYEDRDDSTYWRCSSLWSEYFANRFSHFAGCDEADEWRRLDLLLTHLPELSADDAAARLAAGFGYALGTLTATGANLHGVRPDLTRRLSALGLAAAWLEARTATDELVRSGKCWQSETGVFRLAAAVRMIENCCRYATR